MSNKVTIRIHEDGKVTRTVQRVMHFDNASYDWYVVIGGKKFFVYPECDNTGDTYLTPFDPEYTCIEEATVIINGQETKQAVRWLNGDTTLITTLDGVEVVWSDELHVYVPVANPAPTSEEGEQASQEPQEQLDTTGMECIGKQYIMVEEEVYTAGTVYTDDYATGLARIGDIVKPVKFYRNADGVKFPLLPGESHEMKSVWVPASQEPQPQEPETKEAAPDPVYSEQALKDLNNLNYYQEISKRFKPGQATYYAVHHMIDTLVSKLATIHGLDAVLNPFQNTWVI